MCECVAHLCLSPLRSLRCTTSMCIGCRRARAVTGLVPSLMRSTPGIQLPGHQGLDRSFIAYALMGAVLLFSSRPAADLPQVPSMEIRVEIQMGNTVNLTVDPNTTVMAVKCMLLHKVYIPPKQQQLIFAGMHLEDGWTLGDYHITRESTLQMVLWDPASSSRVSNSCCAAPLLDACPSCRSACAYLLTRIIRLYHFLLSCRYLLRGSMILSFKIFRRLT